MAIIYIDEQRYEVAEQDSLLHACLSLGLDVPYFCWHPALGSVGACRQCAIKQFKNEEDTQGRIVMSCMAPVTEGARISVEHPDVRDFRASVIEWLMTNHPHDCPVCEEGGECHLQDMTVLTGHTYRRFRFNKRTFPNQYLGPFLKHEMNRCITCYRCVRFYRDYAGGTDLHDFAMHHHVYFGRHEDGVLENEFSGNLVEVCPTGVFTDKPFSRHYARKWDLQSAPSVCGLCSVGCNTHPNARYGRLRRILNRYHHEVNGYFLCDRGRFGHDFTNSPQRLRQPLVHKVGDPRPERVAKEQALQHLALLAGEQNQLIGIGSPRASLEANFALRALVGPERFYSGVSESESNLTATAADILQNSPVRVPSLQEIEQADAILVLGEDLTQTAPRLALSLRQAVRQKAFAIADRLKIPRWQDASVREAAQEESSPLFIASAAATRLDDVATQTLHGAPDDLARLGLAVAHQLDSRAPKVPDLSAAQQTLADAIAQTLKGAQRPLVVSGTSSQSQAVLQAAANVAWALNSLQQPAHLYLTLAECNSLGLHLMGGGSLDGAFQAVKTGEAKTAVVLENDLYRRTDTATADAFIEQTKHLVALDHLHHGTTVKAEMALPAGTFAEADGTLISSEGRAQRFFQVLAPEEAIQESWRWLRDTMVAAGQLDDSAWQNVNELTRACAETFPGLRGIVSAAPAADFRIGGMKIPRESHRYSGRTAMHAHVDVSEPQPPADPDSPFSFSMEGYYGDRVPTAAIPYFWAPSWNSVQASNKFQQEVGGPLRGGPPGTRLITPHRAAKVAYFDRIPPAFERRENQWLILPLYHIFGSEELSLQAPAIAERAPTPYVALNPEEAARLQVEPEEAVELSLAGQTHHLAVRYEPSLPLGVGGIPSGLPLLKGLPDLPAWAQILKEAV